MFRIDFSSFQISIGLTSLLLVPLILLSGCTDDEPQILLGTVGQPPPNVSSVTLPAVSHSDVDLPIRAESGRLLIAYFGYASCPDVCPATMVDQKQAVDQLEDDSERLTNYIHAFFEYTGAALRTMDPIELRTAANAFGAACERSLDDEAEPVVAHSAFLFAIDDQGNVLAQSPFGMTSDDIYNDLAYLFDHAT